jgi:hypothetical protein
MGWAMRKSPQASSLRLYERSSEVLSARNLQSDFSPPAWANLAYFYGKVVLHVVRAPIY